MKGLPQFAFEEYELISDPVLLTIFLISLADFHRNFFRQWQAYKIYGYTKFVIDSQRNNKISYIH